MRLLRNICLITLSFGCVHPWGGVFQRYTPELLQFGGGGGNGHQSLYHYARDEPYAEALQSDLTNRIDELIAEETSQCINTPCWDSDICCPGFACFTSGDEEIGRCVPGIPGRRMGEVCTRDNQCDAGLLCQEFVPGEAKVCRPPTGGEKQYNQECELSSECDIARGLCCVLQRRHRQKPRKSCSYFKDPLLCIGPVATDLIQNHVEHTAGEKRLGTYYKRLH